MGSSILAKEDKAALISAILPVYNIAGYLPACMDSLFRQTYGNLELILVDDGSTDGSGALCDEYAKADQRVVVYHKPNGGLSDARNYGIARARGAYITCVDPDDYVDADYIEYLYDLVRKYNVKLAICQHRVWHNGKVIHEYGKVEKNKPITEENADQSSGFPRLAEHNGKPIHGYRKTNEVKPAAKDSIEQSSIPPQPAGQPDKALQKNTNDADTTPPSSLLPAMVCIERMLYHDVIDTSAWGKLYAAELFRGIEYPVGKQFEDIATTYKLMMRAGEVAVGWESKYNYILRDTSIVNSAFNPRKLDLLEMTDGMAREVIETWPELSDAALRRRVYARFSTLNQMLDSDECPEERREIIHFIRDNARAILRNPKAPRRDKLAILTLSLGYPVYRRVWKAYKGTK